MSAARIILYADHLTPPATLFTKLEWIPFYGQRVSADGSWSQRGWSACNGVVAVISIDTRCFLVELMCNLQPNGKKATGRLHFQNGLLELGYPPQRKLFPLSRKELANAGKRPEDGGTISGTGRLTIARIDTI
ncbi:hypothetical protein pdam_00024259 [Pocillopora damicornis]|uniref:Uncharacterized protein n=1 Tax=Pocillopora damicornis TaxID=46731 RepID=A0A3M6UUG9_POCDA|nr:hypothetical protein pdam_00024259 [Pocillopora damicornis]